MTYTAVDGVAALTEQLVEQVTESLATRVSAVMNEHGSNIRLSNNKHLY